MPRISRQDWTPKYAHHKASGKARVRIPTLGERILPGPFGSAESRRAYDAAVGVWIAAGRPGVGGASEQPPADRPVLRLPGDAPAGLTVVELVAAYQRGRDTARWRSALGCLVKAHGETAAADFGPGELKDARALMVESGYCRKTTNGYVAAVRDVFRWGVEQRLIPAGVHQALLAVQGLRKGNREATDHAPVQPVAESVVDDTLKHTSATVAAMVRLQLLTGMRPGEVCRMRTGEIDTSGDVWIYQPAHHKTERFGIDRTIAIGKAAQAILRPYLRRELDQPIFSPREAVEQYRAARAAARRTPLNEGNRAGKGRTRNPQRAAGDEYNAGSFRVAIWRGCDRAFPPPAPLAQRDDETAAAWEARLTPAQKSELAGWRADHRWSPNQLRHTRATTVRKAFGLESAGAVLGHANLRTTEIYAEKDRDLAVAVARKIG